MTLVLHGGHTAGMRPPPPLVIQSDSLPQDAAAELAELVAAAKAAPAPAAIQDRSKQAGGDLMSYSITVEDGGRPVLLRQSDSSMSQAFAALLDWIRGRAKAK